MNRIILFGGIFTGILENDLGSAWMLGQELRALDAAWAIGRRRPTSVTSYAFPWTMTQHDSRELCLATSSPDNLVPGACTWSRFILTCPMLDGSMLGLVISPLSALSRNCQLMIRIRLMMFERARRIISKGWNKSRSTGIADATDSRSIQPPQKLHPLFLIPAVCQSRQRLRLLRRQDGEGLPTGSLIESKDSGGQPRCRNRSQIRF